VASLPYWLLSSAYFGIRFTTRRPISRRSTVQRRPRWSMQSARRCVLLTTGQCCRSSLTHISQHCVYRAVIGEYFGICWRHLR